MGLKVKSQSSSAEPPSIEPGMYDARFDGVEAKTLDKAQFDPDVFIWGFTLFKKGKPLYDQGEPVEVEKMTSQSTNTKSKTTPGAVKVLKAIMSPAEFKAFENEEEIDSDDLVGRMVQVTIAVKDNGWPVVEDVLPARKDD